MKLVMKMLGKVIRDFVRGQKVPVILGDIASAVHSTPGYEEETVERISKAVTTLCEGGYLEKYPAGYVIGPSDGLV